MLSDIDILVITSRSAADADWCSNSTWARNLAAGIYGRPVDVQLVPTTLEEVDDTRHLADSTEGIALRDGIETIAKLRIPARSAPISPPLTDSEHWIPCCADLRELRLSALIAAVVAFSVAESGVGVRGRRGAAGSLGVELGGSSDTRFLAQLGLNPPRRWRQVVLGFLSRAIVFGDYRPARSSNIQLRRPTWACSSRILSSGSWIPSSVSSTDTPLCSIWRSELSSLSSLIP